VRLQPGAVLGRYEVIAPVGRGGMGEVYRARDRHLDRTVALKTIAVGYARDPSSQSRFERERRLTASLEHPHICRLLDAGHDSGIDYLAMEYLQGESLAARLARGPLPVALGIGYAIEIADALDYAHRHGVIHRDVKPANVFLTPSGTKVLDFGLAKLRSADAQNPATLACDTAPLDTTMAGAVVGSAPYMAPERLEGRDADARSDVFGFGVLLYEMLAGRPPFTGSSAAAVIAAILSSEPAPMALSDPRNDEIEWLVRRCLEKNPDDRWQSMADIRAVLKRLASRGSTYANGRRRTRIAVVLPLVAIAFAGAAAIWMALKDRASPSGAAPLTFTIGPPPGGSFTPTESSVPTAQLALSPDGRSLAFVASGPDGASQVWVRRLDAVLPVAVPGTDDAAHPFWSPDARSIGFFSHGLLRRVDLAGGPARTVAVAPNGRGGTWNAEGLILFAPHTAGVIRRVFANGGEVTDATRLEAARGETSHRWPSFLPDGRRFLYFARGGEEAGGHEGIYLGSIGDHTPRLVVTSVHGAVFLPPDRVLFVSEGTLLARVIDFDSGAAVGEPVAIAEGVGGSSTFYAPFSASSTGTIAYASGVATADLVWVDRKGASAGVVAHAGRYVDFRLSRDGGLLALAEVDPTSDRSEIYILDLARGTRMRLTSSTATDASPIWSPDVRQIVFRSNRGRVHDLFVKETAGTAPERPFHISDAPKYPTSWSSDGRWVVFHTQDDETGYDVQLVSSDGLTTARPIAGSRFDDMQAQFSPDGKWVAFTSDESSRPEVYLVSLDDRKVRIQASVNGGADPRWRADGTELFYVSVDGQMTVVGVHPRGDVLEVSKPRALFPVRDSAVVMPYLSSYDVSPDGSRFLVRVPISDVRSNPLTVRMNWSPPALSDR
jgi:eukaryotic-like serine/threonine-protein kinase